MGLAPESDGEVKVEIGLPDLIALRDQAARTGTLFQWSEIAIEWIEHYEKHTQVEHEELVRLRATITTAQDDIALMLRELGLGDHARPVSPHRVVVEEIVPAIVGLRDHV